MEFGFGMGIVIGSVWGCDTPLPSLWGLSNRHCLRNLRISILNGLLNISIFKILVDARRPPELRIHRTEHDDFVVLCSTKGCAFAKWWAVPNCPESCHEAGFFAAMAQTMTHNQNWIVQLSEHKFRYCPACHVQQAANLNLVFVYAGWSWWWQSQPTMHRRPGWPIGFFVEQSPLQTRCHADVFQKVVLEKVRRLQWSLRDIGLLDWNCIIITIIP